MVYLALYKGNRSGSDWRDRWYRLLDAVIRRCTGGQYSHCELAVLGIGTPVNRYTQYVCYSASLRDGGVRRKVMLLPADKWDLIPLPAVTTAQIEQHYTATKGSGYDLPGAIGLVLPARQRRQRWFCSEWCAEVMGLPESWRYSPNSLAGVHKPTTES